MYLAQLSTFQSQVPFYITILENIIKGNNEEKANIDSAIYEAIEIARGEKNIFTIDNNHYFLITTLLSKYNTGLLSIDNKNIKSEVYSEILDVLK